MENSLGFGFVRRILCTVCRFGLYAHADKNFIIAFLVQGWKEKGGLRGRSQFARIASETGRLE
jgi:hypothetical protein